MGFLFVRSSKRGEDGSRRAKQSRQLSALRGARGFKSHPHRHLGARLDGRVFATFADIDGRTIVCSPGFCLVALSTDVVWQAEFSAAVVIAF